MRLVSLSVFVVLWLAICLQMDQNQLLWTTIVTGLLFLALVIGYKIIPLIRKEVG